MKAHYREKLRTWEVKVTLHGKRQSFYGATEEAALKKAELAQNLTSMSSKDTLRDYAIGVYMPTLRNHSLKWKEQVLWALDGHILPAFGRKPLTDLDRHMIQTFLLKKLDTLSRSSVGHLRKVLHAILKLAEADDRIPKNPVSLVKLPPDRTVQAKPYTIEEARLLLIHSKGMKCHNAILMALGWGLREGECLGVLKTDLRNGWVSIERQHGTKPLKTASSYRSLPIGKLSFEKWPGQYLSPERSVRNLLGTLKEPVRGYAAVTKKAGLRYVSFHGLRKTFATSLESVGCPEGLIRAILGHSRGSVTRLYIENSPELIERYVGEVHELLLEVTNEREVEAAS